MRSILLAAALIAAPSTAFAADDSAKPSMSAEEIKEKLTDPVEQQRLATAMEAMTEAIMQMPVGPLLNAAAQAGGEVPKNVAPNATIGDLAGPEAKAAPREIAAKIPALLQMMGGMAASLEALKPMLEQMGKQLENDFEQAMETPPSDAAG